MNAVAYIIGIKDSHYKRRHFKKQQTRHQQSGDGDERTVRKAKEISVLGTGSRGGRGHTLPVRCGHWVKVLDALKYDRNLKHKLTTKYQMFLAI